MFACQKTKNPFSPVARIKQWNVEDGQLLNTYFGHDNYINVVAFSPIRNQFISSGSDSNIRMWNILELDRNYSRLKGHDSYESMLENGLIYQMNESEKKLYLINDD